MIPWSTIQEWGTRLTVLTGIATPVYGGLAYLKLTPVTESYVTSKIEEVRKDIGAARVDTLDTKRVVLGLARSDLVREQQALEGALKTETNAVTLDSFNRRIETIKTQIESIDRKTQKLDDKIETMKGPNE
jgi:predicted  nucleic acid-binding Zn-ribbon protein